MDADITATEEHPAAVQEAPWPAALEHLVERAVYRPGWRLRLVHADRGQGSRGLTLIITTCGYNSYHPVRGETYRVNHYMPVPPAAYSAQSWQRWLFEQFLLVERHEAMEFFAVCDSPGSEHRVRPYAPNHGPGWDPYLVTELSTDLDRRTSFTGAVNGVNLDEKFTPEEGRSILAAIAADPELDRLVAEAITIRRTSPDPR
jgi:hypothetical protein